MSAFILPGNPVKLQQSSAEHQQLSAEHQQPSDEHQQLSDDHQQPSDEHQQQSGECKPPPVVDSNNSGNATAIHTYIVVLHYCLYVSTWRYYSKVVENIFCMCRVCKRVLHMHPILDFNYSVYVTQLLFDSQLQNLVTRLSYRCTYMREIFALIAYLLMKLFHLNIVKSDACKTLFHKSDHIILFTHKCKLAVNLKLTHFTGTHMCLRV